MDSDDHIHHSDLIRVVGTMTKEEKTKYISKFLSKKYNLYYNINVLCATSRVGNSGIDSPNVHVVYHIYISPYLLGVNQEKGRAVSRDEDFPNDYKYIMCFFIETSIQLYCCIWDMSEQILDPGYRVRQLDELNGVARMLLGRECFHTVL